MLKYQIYDAFGVPVKSDRTTHSLQIIDYAHKEIHSGSHYFVVDSVDMGVDEVLDFTWQTPDSAKWAHWVWDISTDNAVEWFVYEDAVVTTALANTVTPNNSNRNSSNRSVTTMKYELQAGLAAANADTDVTGATQLKHGKTAAGSKFTMGGGSSGRESEIILRKNTLYCLRAIAGDTLFLNFDMEWYEHTNKG